MAGSGLRAQLAVFELGLEPVGMVLGAGAYQLFRPVGCSRRGGSSRTDGKPSVFPRFERSSARIWSEVIGRLHMEAVNLGAHLVLGVTVETSSPPSGGVQLQLSGTGLRLADEPATDRPALSTLGMAEYQKLLLAGWAPCGIAWGLSAVHVHGWAMSALAQGAVTVNTEMPAPTAGVQLARRRAAQSAALTMRALGADGAIGMTTTLTRQSQACGGGQGLLLEGQMLGTAVVRYRKAVAAVEPVRDLRGARP